ncbi:MAG: ATPase subunit of ABC transporter with duplicated ATPase domains [Glaciecola sp.]
MVSQQGQSALINVHGLAFIHAGAMDGFDDASFVIPSGAHAALIGDNGVGKTTLIRLLAGELEPDDGEATITGTVRYMPQEVGFDDPSATLRMMLGRFAPEPLDAINDRICAAEVALEAGDLEAGMDLGDAWALWGDMGGYELEAVWDQACRAIVGQGFDALAHRTVAQLSGGERKRLVLEVLFTSGVDVLLLDEPDNYLDIPAKLRLQEQIRDSSQTILMISHDRDLLSGAPDRVITLEGRGAWVHHGTYATYEEAFENRQESLGDELQRWEDEEKRLRDFVRILKERARYSPVFAKKANAAESRLKRFVAQGPPPPPSSEQTVSMALRGRGSGKRMLKLEGLGIPGLVETFSDEVHHGERIGLIGPNGTGKTHLIRALASDPTSEHEGQVTHGARVEAGYFAQVTDHTELVGKTPLAIVRQYIGNEQRARATLARYGLATNVRQEYETLSGGQKARLEILTLELTGVNLLLLDEPTDNLDLASAAALETALDGYDGAVLAVSHDRAFLRSLDRFLHIGEDGRVHSLSDYEAAMIALVNGVDEVGKASARLLS